MNSAFTFVHDFLTQGRGYDWGMHPRMMDWGYGMSWFSHIIMVVFWIAAIVGIVFLIKWMIVSARSGEVQAGPRDSALDILKKRYARGEIDKEEFEEKKRDLAV